MQMASVSSILLKTKIVKFRPISTQLRMIEQKEFEFSLTSPLPVSPILDATNESSKAI